mgnify:CR=1 FL=1
MNRDITSANASATLVLDLFPAGVKLEQFSADGAWSQDNYSVLETRMGVDGYMAAGYTPVEKEVTFHFQANSPSIEKLNLIWQTMETTKTALWCNITITVPSIKMRYICANGVLMNYKMLPNAEKVLEPIDATFRFESVTAVPM